MKIFCRHAVGNRRRLQDAVAGRTAAFDFQRHFPARRIVPRLLFKLAIEFLHFRIDPFRVKPLRIDLLAEFHDFLLSLMNMSAKSKGRSRRRLVLACTVAIMKAHIDKTPSRVTIAAVGYLS